MILPESLELGYLVDQEKIQALGANVVCAEVTPISDSTISPYVRGLGLTGAMVGLHINHLAFEITRTIYEERGITTQQLVDYLGLLTIASYQSTERIGTVLDGMVDADRRAIAELAFGDDIDQAIQAATNFALKTDLGSPLFEKLLTFTVES